MTREKDISDDISILYQDESWFRGRSLIGTKIEAIKRIGFYGDVQSMQSILPYIIHGKEEVRNVSIKSISNIFTKVDPKIIYESSIRHCNITKSNLRNYVKYCKGEELKYPIAIASLNSNGYIREDALNLIQENKLGTALLPYIIYRLGDWVPEVRAIALQNFNEVLSYMNINVILENIDLILWLKRVKRVDLSKIYNKAIDFLVVQNQTETFLHYIELNEKQRFFLCTIVLKQPIIEPSTLDLLLKDKSYQVRSKVAENINNLAISNLEVNTLQKDKSSLVRQRCLESRIKNTGNLANINFEYFLMDASATIRNTARHYLKWDNDDYLKLYKSKLNDLFSLEVAIYGVGEVGSKDDAKDIVEYLDISNSKIKKATIRALIKLEYPDLRNRLLCEIDNKYSSIRGLAIDQVSKSANHKVIEKARQIYINGNIDLKLSMLSLFSKDGSSKTFPDIIIALTENHKIVSNAAWSYLAIWRKKAITNYNNPTDFEIDRARKIYQNTSFEYELSDSRKQLWNELPYYGRFDI